MLPPALGGLKRFARRRMSPGALYLHKAVGAELRRPLDVERGGVVLCGEIRDAVALGEVRDQFREFHACSSPLLSLTLKSMP